MTYGKKPRFFTPPPKFCILTMYSGNMDLGLPFKMASNTFIYGLSKKPSLKENGFTDFLEMNFEVGQIDHIVILTSPIKTLISRKL
jgi:hypothetical protein